MDNSYPQSGKLRLLGSPIIMVAIMTLTACAESTQLTTSRPELTEVPAATSVPNPTARPLSPTDATHQADEQALAQYVERRRTAVALTPTQHVPPITPQPTPTWWLGMGGCANANGSMPQMINCWRGIVNGEIVSVASGRGGSFGDPSQGLIMVFAGPLFDPTASTTDVYSTPMKLGGVRIVSVDGTRFTLTPYDHRTPGPTATPGITFVFDLATRQWVNP